jgi:hypothetical protein
MEGTRKVPSRYVGIVSYDVQQDKSRHYLDRNSKYFLKATAWLYAVSRAENNFESAAIASVTYHGVTDDFSMVVLMVCSPCSIIMAT